MENPKTLINQLRTLISQDPTPETIEMVAEHLHHPQPNVQVAAAEVLIGWHTPATFAPLQEWINYCWAEQEGEMPQSEAEAVFARCTSVKDALWLLDIFKSLPFKVQQQRLTVLCGVLSRFSSRELEQAVLETYQASSSTGWLWVMALGSVPFPNRVKYLAEIAVNSPWATDKRMAKLYLKLSPLTQSRALAA